MIRLIPPVLGVLIGTWFLAQLALTSSNSVPQTALGLSDLTITARNLAPAVCSGLSLTDLIVFETGVARGSQRSDLLIGAPGIIRMLGLGGDDCLIAPSGFMGTIDGGQGFDVCVGNAAATFQRCEVEVYR